MTTEPAVGAHGDPILDLFYELKLKYGALLDEFKQDDLYINRDFESAGIIPDDTSDPGLRLTKPSNVYDAVENAANHILSFPRTIVPVRPVSKDKETAIKIAQKKQRLLEICWDRFFTEQGDPLGIAKKQLIKGKAVLRLDIDWRLLPELSDSPTAEEKRKFRATLQRVARSKFLWKLRAVPKETVFEDIENPHDPAYVFESYTCTAGEAKRRWPYVADKLTARSDLERVEYLEYWSKPQGDDRGEYIQWVDGKRVHAGINPYSWETPLHTDEAPDYDGRVPHVIGDPGWGDIGPETKPEDRYVSLVRPMRSMALADCRMLTTMEAYLRNYVWKPLLVSGYPDDQKFPIGPAAVWERDPETQSIDLLQFGEMPVSLLQGMQRIRSYMDEHTRFGTLGGTPQRGVDTATEATQNVQLASSVLSSPVRTLRRMATKINTGILQDNEYVLEVAVTVYGATRVGESEITLSPREIGGFHLTNVELETADEAQLSIRLARIFSDMYSKIPISAEGVLEKVGFDDPRGEMDRRLLEDLEKSPQAMQVLTMAMLTGLSETVSPAQLVQQAFAQALSRLQGGGAPGTGDPPPVGAAPAAPQANPVEDLRAATRDEAIAAQPERSYQ